MRIKIVTKVPNDLQRLGSDDEAQTIRQGLWDAGHVSRLTSAVVGLNGDPIGFDEWVVLPPRPADQNDMLEDFIRRHAAASIAWRPGPYELPLVISCLPRVKVLHLSLESAHALTGINSAAEAGLKLGRLNPDAAVVVSNAIGASACHHRGIVTVGSLCNGTRATADGKGAAFFGGFLGEFLNSRSLPLALAAGHRYGLAMAAGELRERETFMRSLSPTMSAA